jgi:ABC-type multidrug transport system permease subunit
VDIVSLHFSALLTGALFRDLGERHDCELIINRATLLFVDFTFYAFLRLGVIPFTVMERGVVNKEVLNKYYHPIAYQVAQALASILGAALLAFLVSLIAVTMVKFNDPCWYFLNMFLALTMSEALAQLVSHVVPHFVIGMALHAGLLGFFMPFQGFILVPSDFPDWLRWTYNVLSTPILGDRSWLLNLEDKNSRVRYSHLGRMCSCSLKSKIPIDEMIWVFGVVLFRFHFS